MNMFYFNLVFYMGKRSELSSSVICSPIGEQIQSEIRIYAPDFTEEFI